MIAKNIKKVGKINIFFTKIKTSLQGFEIKFIRREYLAIIIPILVLILAILFYAPFLFNNNNLRFQIEQKISQHTKGNLEIKGDVKIYLIPSPSIVLKDAILKNYTTENKNYNIYIKETKIKLSFLASLIGKFSVKEISFINPLIERHSVDNLLEIKSQKMNDIINSLPEKKDKSGIGGNLFSIKNLDITKFDILNLPKISVQNLDLIDYSKIGNKSEIKNLSGDFTFSKNAIIGQGNFFNEDIENKFDLNFKANSKENDSFISLNSSYANFKIYGTFFNNRLIKNPPFGQYFKGILEAEIFNLKDFYKSFITKEGFVFDRINPSTKSIKIKSGITKDKSEIVMDSIFISSNLLNGRGDININLSNKIPLLDVKLILENVDMDAIWLSDNIQKNNQIQNQETQNNLEEKKSENYEKTALDLTKDFRDIDLTFETKISRIRYLAEEIRNLDIYITISKQGEILILPLKFETPGDGEFRISGVVEKRNNLPKFIGKIDAKGKKLADLLRFLKISSQNLKYDSLKEYSIYSDLMLMPKSTVFNNFYLNINNQNTEFLGEMQINYNKQNSNIISNFEVHNLNIDDYFLTSGQNIYLSPGDLLKKVLWLNNLTSKNDLTLNFDKLRYKNLTFKNQSLKARFGSGYIEIDDLNLESPEFDLKTSLAINIKEIEPRFDISLSANNFNYNSSNIATFIDENNLTQNSQTKKLNWVDQFFALPSLENLNGNLKINFKNSNFDNLNIKDLEIDGKLKRGIIDFTKFTGKIYDGEFDFKGSSAIKFEKFLSGNLTLKNAKIKPILSDLTKIENIDGICNISSSIASFGNKQEDFIKNLNSDLNFSAAQISVVKFGLDDLVKKMFNPFFFQAELENPLSILTNQEAVTKLSTASGTISTNRNRENRFRSDFSGTALNGIISGKFDFIDKSIEGSSNIIFLTGNKKKQIPINIASNFNGKFTQIFHNTNIDQALQYIKAAKEQINRGATELQFKEESATKIQENNQPQNPQQNLNLNPQDLQMIESTFSNGISNLQEQIQNQQQNPPAVNEFDEFENQNLINQENNF